MNKIPLLFVVSCTAGAVAVQGQGFLIPVTDAQVKVYFQQDGVCKQLTRTTDSNGRFTFYGKTSTGDIDPNGFVAQGTICIQVKDPNVPSTFRYYQYNHAFDSTCDAIGGGTIPCSKDLLMWTASYDELSANAPTDPQVHVRFPMPSSGVVPPSLSSCAPWVQLCNIK